MTTKKKAEQGQPKVAGEAKATAEVKVETAAQPAAEVEFPLPEDHYFHPKTVSRRAHWGEPQDRAAIRSIQRNLSVPETGLYDAETAAAVRNWREQHGMGRSEFVDAEAWRALHGQ